MANYDTTKEETQTHIDNVGRHIDIVCDLLKHRAVAHDITKLSSPEIDYFAFVDRKTLDTKYGTEEYNKALEELKPALENHYAKNRHHPEHFPNGVSGMNLIDLVEMLCDWKASTLRYKEGNILKSIEVNAKRFSLSPDLTAVLRNTAELFELI